MKISVKKEVEAKYLDLDMAVRNDDEDMPYDAPLRDGKSWRAVIDLASIVIRYCPWCGTRLPESLRGNDA